MSKLPLKIQVGVRDLWENDDTPVQKSIKTLKELVGVDVIVRPEWQALLSELESVYTDKSTFVPAVVSCIQAWSQALSSLLDDESNEKWTDELLENAEGRLRAFLEVSKEKRPSLAWANDRKGFIVYLPKAPLPYPMELQSILKDCMINCFNEKAAPPAALAHRPSAADDWADVSVDTKTGKAAVVEAAPASHPASSQPAEILSLPDLGLLARPDELLMKPPYHMVVYNKGYELVEAQSSHSPSLQLMADYLKKWARLNHNDVRTPPGVEVKLHQAAFGLGLIYDRLTVSVENRYSQFTLSPMTLLAFAEGVLGYKVVHCDGSSWTMRKDSEFRSSQY